MEMKTLSNLGIELFSITIGGFILIKVSVAGGRIKFAG